MRPRDYKKLWSRLFDWLTDEMNAAKRDSLDPNYIPQLRREAEATTSRLATVLVKMNELESGR